MSTLAVDMLERPVADAVFDPFAGGVIERAVASTEAQREVWLADRLGKAASLAYNETLTMRLRGPIDLPALGVAVDALVKRHEALRSTFSADGAQLLIAEPTGGWLRVEDLSTKSMVERNHALDTARARAVQQAFDLETGPLFRAELYALATNDHLLLMVAHHAVCDGWSWGLIAQELGQLYGECIGEAPAPDAPNSYTEYAAWERTQAASPDMQVHVDYWLSRFNSSSLPVLELPVDRPRPTVRTFSSLRQDHLLDPALTDALRKFSARQGTSLYATLFSGFATLLHRLSAQDDVVIGIAAAGQMAADMPRLVGHCVNVLPLRVAVDPHMAFDALVRQSGSLLLDAFEHQNLTYGSLLRKLPMTRDASRLPLVSVLFNVDGDAAPNSGSFPHIAVELDSIPRVSENFELFVNIAPRDGGMRIELQYNCDLFEAATVARWLRLYESLLRSATSAPTCKLGEMDLLTSQDTGQLRALQPSPIPRDRTALMHSAFVVQATAQPDRVALRCGNEALSYGQLDQRANRLAQTLRGRGVQRGALVGLCLPRGTDMVVALMAVLKSGAAYVPLDPDFPAARLDYYAADAQLALLITRSTVSSAPRTWRADAGAYVLELDTDTSWLDQSALPLPAGNDDASPTDPAYVIYTSGSTGQPKGVAVPHGAVANFLQSMRDQPGIACDDRLVAVTTLSFDIAVLELILPLTVGAEVVIASREVAINGQDLGELIDHHGATVMQATPGMWRVLLDSGWQCRGPFKALVGGEALPPELARDLVRATSEVWNMYGPTETTIWSTLWRVDLARVERVGVSIGQPIANTNVWIVDERLQPLPVGVPGEICIGGDGIAIGYLGRRELTDERFPVAAIAGVPERLYRTGDRGRWRNDGLLEHMGRLDFQVKVRGYRIELGEIEARCNEAPGVASSVVVTREDGPGDVRIVAYLARRPEDAIDATQMRQHLARFLPEYMQPHHYVILDALPMLPNGKVDRKALPAPVTAVSDGRNPAVAPRNDVEHAVLAGMEEVLRLPGLSIHDDFFALGGHSLLAARLSTMLGRRFALRLPLATLFEAPTAARLAERIEMLRTSGTAVQAAPVQGVAARRNAPLTPMQERIRFVEQLHPGRSVYNAPSAHRLHGTLDVERFQAALQAIVDRQAALRTTIGNDAEGRPRQRIAERLTVELPITDLRGLPAPDREDELAGHLQALADRPFDIQAGPLFRFALFRTADDEHVFLFVPHHLIWDGWSFDLFQTELSTIYRALVEERAHGLPPLSAGYGDFAEWQAQWMQTQDFARQLAHWKQRFAVAPRTGALPTDHPRRAGMSGEGGNLWLRVDAPLTTKLREVARLHDVTLNMLCFGVYVLLMAPMTTTEAIVIATPVRGREAAEFEPVMGFFNNVLPLAFQLDRSLSVGSFMQFVKAELLDVMNVQQVPFERMVSEPEFAERVQGAGLYQALFSFQDARDRPDTIGGLTHSQVHLQQRGATDDLGLWLMDKATGVEGAVTYNAEIYAPKTAEAFRERYIELLTRVVAQPTASVSELLTVEGSDAATYLQHLATRVAVAAPQPTAPMRVNAIEAPNSKAPMLPPEQALLAQIWAGVIGVDVEEIRPTDGFFDIGGDSLMAMRAIEQAETVLGFKVEPRRYVFETLAQLATSTAGTAAQEAATASPTPEQPARRGLFGRVRSLLGKD